MIPVSPVDANMRLECQGGVKSDVMPLDVVVTNDENGNTYVTSLWEPNEVERTALLAGLPVMVTIWGNRVPPMSVQVAREVDRVTELG